MQLKQRFPLDIQCFASEGDRSNQATQNGESSGDKKSLNKLLEDKELQSQFDKKVADALETNRVKLEKLNQKVIKEAVEIALLEQEKQMLLLAEQKERVTQERSITEKAKQEYENKLLLVSIQQELVESSLPKELISLVMGSTMEESKEKIELYQSLVTKGIQEGIDRELGMAIYSVNLILKMLMKHL